MKHNPRASIQRMADLMQVTLTEEQMEKVVEKSSFEYMKTHEEKLVPPSVIFRNDQGRVIGSGKAGGAAEFISAEQQSRIDDLALSELSRLGSDFPYAELFLKQPAE